MQIDKKDIIDDRERNIPLAGDLLNGSPCALISFSPAAFRQQLGHSTRDRGHQDLRYRSGYVIYQNSVESQLFTCYDAFGKEFLHEPRFLE